MTKLTSCLWQDSIDGMQRMLPEVKFMEAGDVGLMRHSSITQRVCTEAACAPTQLLRHEARLLKSSWISEARDLLCF